MDQAKLPGPGRSSEYEAVPQQSAHHSGEWPCALGAKQHGQVICNVGAGTTELVCCRESHLTQHVSQQKAAGIAMHGPKAVQEAVEGRVLRPGTEEAVKRCCTQKCMHQGTARCVWQCRAPWATSTGPVGAVKLRGNIRTSNTMPPCVTCHLAMYAASGQTAARAALLLWRSS